MKIIDNKSALKRLKRGLPIVFQTDTLPAIACLPKFSKVIYKIKKRDKKKPLILMGANKQQLIDYVHESAKEDYGNIASKYWPGALTMIIPVSKKGKSSLTSENLSLGLRVPNSEMAQALIGETGPLLTSSANISGIRGSTTADGVAYEFPDISILGPVPWAKCSGSASTIISWVKFGSWELIREGEVTFERML